nr:hypothetical protein [Tanacetum cinerariifolium]
ESNETEPFEEGKTAATPPPFGYRIAASESIPEADIPLRKRARFTTPTSRYEIGESSVVAAAASALVTQMEALRRDVSTLQRQHIEHAQRDKMAPKKRTTRLNPGTTPVTTPSTTTTSITNAQQQAMINEGVNAALAARDATRNGDDSHTSGTGARRPVQAARECSYSKFMKCKPLDFKGCLWTHWTHNVKLVMEAPPSPDYIPGPEAPPSPNYIPGPEAPPSPDYIPRHEAPPSPDYILGPEYPEYQPPADDMLPAEEQPLPAAVSPTVESPGYITKSVPEMEPEENDSDDEKSEGDSIDYSTSGGDNDANDDGDDLSEDDADGEDEEESSDSEEEEEEHLASTLHAPALYSSVSASEETEPFEEGETAATPPPFGYRVAARISIQPHILMPFRSESEIRPTLTIADKCRTDDKLIGRLRREWRYFRTVVPLMHRRLLTPVIIILGSWTTASNEST